MRLRSLGPSIVIEAPAKLNLFLEVLQRRPDGYHDLETVMVAIDVFDTLRLSPAADASLQLTLSFDRRLDERVRGEVPKDERNLCMKAARLMQEEYGVKRGAVIELHKRIPPQSGMGGGSSDAAAAIVGLNRLWDLKLSSSELHALAARLGSDLNFFIDSPGAAVCLGRGEQVENLPQMSPLNFVVAVPQSGVSTSSAFGALKGGRPPASAEGFIKRLQTGRPHAIAAATRNALQQPAMELNPDVAGLLDQMQSAARLPPLMTGSGSGCYAICGTRGEAVRLAARLRGRHPGPVWVCQSLATEAA